MSKNLLKTENKALENDTGIGGNPPMNQAEKRQYLIRALLDEQPRYRGMRIPLDESDQKRLLRSLFNIRLPGSVSIDFLTVQDEYLKDAAKEKGITNLRDLTPVMPGIYLW